MKINQTVLRYYTTEFVDICSNVSARIDIFFFIDTMNTGTYMQDIIFIE